MRRCLHSTTARARSSTSCVGAPRATDALVEELAPQFGTSEVEDTIAELRRVRAIGDTARQEPTPKILPLKPVPLQTLVVNVTNQCNLACTYCYEYGEDKIVDTENGKQPKFMTAETARASVDFALRESRENRSAHITFFGGETLMNFPVLKSTIAYARARAAEVGKDIDFSLTTNATLLKPDVIEFLAEERVGVTISIDGPEDLQNRFRVFKNGTGSYDIAAPKIKALLARHRSRPIGARVTLTRQTLDVRRIYQHLTDDIGFWEVGFAPVTTAPSRDYAIADGGFDELLTQFRALAEDYLHASLENRHHGFSNVRETLQEIHQGHAKAYPCGAGIGLMGVATDGDVALCHRFAGRTRTSSDGVRGRQLGAAAGVSHDPSHRGQNGLPHLLGATDLRGRVLSRSQHALRIDDACEPALLRMDSRLDAHVPRDLRRARGEKPGVPAAVR